LKKLLASEEKEEEDTWRKPKEGWVKCNVDASYMEEKT
jgi:hypothetical protein